MIIYTRILLNSNNSTHDLDFGVHCQNGRGRPTIAGRDLRFTESL